MRVRICDGSAAPRAGVQGLVGQRRHFGEQPGMGLASVSVQHSLGLGSELGVAARDLDRHAVTAFLNVAPGGGPSAVLLGDVDDTDDGRGFYRGFDGSREQAL